jgi:ankyrin repeat protein
MDTIEHTNSPHHSPRPMRTSSDADRENKGSPTSVRTDIITASEEPENGNSMEPLPATLRPSSPHAASSVNNTVPEILKRDDNGQTPLHRAAENGNKELVEVLLAHGAEKEPRDHKKQIPLHLAASSGDFDTAVALLGPGRTQEINTGKQLCTSLRAGETMDSWSC